MTLNCSYVFLYFLLLGVLDISGKSLNAAAWMFCGWFLHYIPFYAMGRVLYFHHYFPALIFNSMLTGMCDSSKTTTPPLCFMLFLISSNVSYHCFLFLSQNTGPMLCYVIKHFSKRIQMVVICSVLIVLMYSFVLFSPLAYGMSGPIATDANSTMRQLKWLQSWEF